MLKLRLARAISYGESKGLYESRATSYGESKGLYESRATSYGESKGLYESRATSYGQSQGLYESRATSYGESKGLLNAVPQSIDNLGHAICTHLKSYINTPVQKTHRQVLYFGPNTETQKYV